MMEVKVLIVEDEPLIAEDIASSLKNNDFSVSAVVYSKEDALFELEHNTPDLVILDINLNGNEEGIGIASVINAKYMLPFVYLTSYSDKTTLLHAKNTLPAGYIVKPFTDAGLFAALEVALFNHTQKNKQLFPDLNETIINGKLSSALTDREFDVVKLVYDGKTNNQVAEDLFISVNTVKAHIKNIHQKLDTDSRSTLIARLRQLMVK